MFNENELKISLTKEEYDKLVAMAGKEAVTQVNHYFDTGDKSLMLRIRYKRGRYALQFKRRVGVKDDVFNSVEQGVEVDKKFFDEAVSRGADKNFVNENFGCGFNNNLPYLGYGVTYRTAFDYFGYKLEVDKTTVDDVTYYELECESDDESIRRLKEILKGIGVAIKPSAAKSEIFLKIKGLI